MDSTELLVMQANQMQITDRMISILKDTDSERSGFVHTEELELRNPKKGKPRTVRKSSEKKGPEDVYSVDTDESEEEMTQDQKKKQEQQAVNQNKKQESSDLQLQLDEISRLLRVEPLSKEERAELECLRQKHRDRILNSASADSWDVSEAVDRRYTQDIKQIMLELLNKTSQRDETTLREELEQKLRKVQTQRCGEEQIEQLIQRIIVNEKAEQKDRERKRKENEFKKEWKRQRALEREREAERRMQMEERFEEMKRKMVAEIYMMKQELEMERDRRKRIKKQAKQKLQRLRERIRILKREIEELKETPRTERTAWAKRRRELVEGQRKTKQNESRNCGHAPSEGGVKDARVAINNNQGWEQKLKRHFMAVFAWILKGLRCGGSALALFYNYFRTLFTL